MVIISNPSDLPFGWQMIFNSSNTKFYLSPDRSKKFSSLKKVERFLNGTPKKEWVTPDLSKYTTKKRKIGILVTKKKEKLSKRARTECK